MRQKQERKLGHYAKAQIRREDARFAPAQPKALCRVDARFKVRRGNIVANALTLQIGGRGHVR